jgi:hypothetical protein
MSDTIFDTFVSYNSMDRDSARNIAQELRKAGLSIWFDQWELRPGKTWQDELEVNIIKSRSVVVLIGPSGIAPWQAPEVRAALTKYMQDSHPVIPVLLPGVDKIQLPLFLEQHMWIDCRAQQLSQESIDRLIWGITGRRTIHYVSQLGDEFLMKVKTGQGLEKSIRLFTLPNPRDDKLLNINWDTFGRGIEILQEQIQSPGSRIVVDACFGINDAGLAMASFVNYAALGRAKLGYIRTGKLRGKPVILENSLYPILSPEPALMIFDFEIKHANVLGLIIEELKKRYVNPIFYLSIFGALTEAHDLNIVNLNELVSANFLNDLEFDDLFIATTMHPPGIEPPLGLP